MEAQVFDRYLQSNHTAYLDPNPGGGLPLVLLHGLGADGSSWSYQFPALIAAGYRPLAPDLPGFGRSCWEGRHWNIRSVTGQLVDWLDGLGIERAAVAGISMGGAFALRLALDFPGRVERLALVSAFACLRPRSRSETVYLLRRLMVASLQGVDRQAELVAQRLFPKQDQADLREELVQRILQSNRQVYRAAMLELGFFDVRRRLKEIGIPTLVITGERDNTVPAPIQTEMANGIPGALQVFIPDGGHAVIVDQPERFNQELLAFLKRA